MRSDGLSERLTAAALPFSRRARGALPMPTRLLERTSCSSLAPSRVTRHSNGCLYPVPIETICTIQQLSNRRYVDAYKSENHDFALVTRETKNSDDQKWLFRTRGADLFTIQQWSSRRYMDAHEIAGKDFAVVTAPPRTTIRRTGWWIVSRVDSAVEEGQYDLGRKPLVGVRWHHAEAFSRVEIIGLRGAK